MSSRPQGDAPVDGNTILSVGEFNRRVARLLERSVPLVWVSGEVSNFMKAASGHWYFSLKDGEAQVRCVMFRNANRLIDWRIKEGDRIEVRAVAGLYVPRGEFQLSVESMRQTGAGALYEAFLRIKAKLESEGLFDPDKKRPLPAFPKAIGVVTSMQAAALRDVLTALARRAPHVRIIVYPSAVQGRDAPARLIDAIHMASLRAERFFEIDVLLVVRGGGSIEDLAAFNDEGVARAIASAAVPVVSGVGHETDVTIADFVADLRAATPTAAAELASPDAPRILAALAERGLHMRRATLRRIEFYEQRLDDVQRRLKSPEQRLALRWLELRRLAAQLQRAQQLGMTRRQEAWRQASLHLYRARPDVLPFASRLAQLARHRRQAFDAGLKTATSRLDVLSARLHLLDPNAALQRGYAIVEQGDGAIVDGIDKLKRGDLVTLRFLDGAASAEVRAVEDSKPR